MFYNKPKAIAALISAWVIFIAGAVLLICAKIKCKDYIKTDAVIVYIDKTNEHDTAVYRYTARGKTFETLVEQKLWTTKKEGDHVTVRYDPNDPEKPENTSENTLILGVTLAFGVSAAVSTIEMIRRIRAEDDG